MSKRLTYKQRRFVDCYAGNGVEAARKAGYQGNANTLHVVAAENLRKPTILAAIEARQEDERQPDIMDRQARQRLWSRMARDESLSVSDRLRASELLGKSEADFTDKRIVDQTHGGMTQAERDALAESILAEVARGQQRARGTKLDG